MSPIRYTLPAAMFCLCALLTIPAAAQDEIVPAPDARLSPLMLARTTLDDGTYVKIHYSSPQRRHPETGQTRTIFGELVPYGELWRTGANEAAEITFTQDVTFAGRPVPAGTYALFTIPDRTEWTVILNRALGLEGSEDYDESLDAVRVTVPSATMPETYEAFTIDFSEADGGADMNLMWEQSRVTVPIRVR